jgi:hypothetical protein
MIEPRLEYSRTTWPVARERQPARRRFLLSNGADEPFRYIKKTKKLARFLEALLAKLAALVAPTLVNGVHSAI